MLAEAVLIVMAVTRQAPGATVRVDSAHHRVIIEAGPWDVAASSGVAGPMHHMAVAARRFTWPITGWVRGVHLALRDGSGKAISRAIVHHVEVVNLARRQLAFPAAERLVGFGQETGDIELPPTIGVPVNAGAPMALDAAWHNESSTNFRGVTMLVTFDWIPANEVPRPQPVFPVTLVVSPAIFRESAFDLPPGETEFHRDFAWPISGRVLAVGAHLHDFGNRVTLQDVTNPGRPRRVAQVVARQAADGKVLSVSRSYPGLLGAGLRLLAGHVYRLTGHYHNTGAGTIPGGAMTHMVLVFVPDHPERWPAVNPADTLWQLDMRGLFEESMDDMAGMEGGTRH